MGGRGERGKQEEGKVGLGEAYLQRYVLVHSLLCLAHPVLCRGGLEGVGLAYTGISNASP